MADELSEIPMWSLPRRRAYVQPGPRVPPWLAKFSGGMDRMFGLNNTPSPYLLPDEQQAAAQRQRMAMAGALLSAAGPRPQGTQGLLEPIGQAMQAGQASQSQSLDEAMRMRMIQAQLMQAQQGGQERADPNVIRALVMAGIDPKSEEGKKIVISSLTGGNDALAAIQAQLDIDRRRDEITRNRAADDKAAAEAARTKAQTENTLRRSIAQTAKIAELNEKLEGSFLEAGIPASSWRRTAAGAIAGLGAAAGFDTGNMRADLDSYDQLKKNLADQLNNLVSTGTLGQVTNDKLQSFRDALANTETSPGALMAIQANIAETLLDEADAQGFEVENRAQVEANIERWREYETKAADPVLDVPGAARSAAEIGRMTFDQLKSLDPSQMTKEMLEAAQKRWDELNNAGPR